MRKIGLDLGSSSAGWAINEDGSIIDEGVITFHTGMSKGQSGGYVSPTRERRETRAKRNLIKSRKYRKSELLKELIDREFVPLEESELELWSKYKKGQLRKFPESPRFLKWLACDFTYEGGENYKNPYQVRVKALDERLSKHEFGRALYHLVQRRGYKDIGETDIETENQIKRRNEEGFKDALDKHGTIAKALSEEFIKKGIRARNQYPLREEYHYELEVLCKAQGYCIEKEGKNNYKDDFVKKLWKAIIWQQPLKTQRGNIGKCTLEPQRPRCPISHPVFEISRAWQFINTIKYYDENDLKQPLNQEMRKQLFFDKFLKKDSNFKFDEIKTFLDAKFKKNRRYNYPLDRRTGKYDTSVSGMPVCKGLIGIFGEKVKPALGEIDQFDIGNAPKIIDKYSIYDLWHIIFDFDQSHLEQFAIEKLNIQNITRKRKKKDVVISPLIELKDKFSKGYASLSLKALCKIIPFLKEGYLYNEAVLLAKIPELTGGGWQQKKGVIIKALTNANNVYNYKQDVTNIANNLIDIHKGLMGSEKFAPKDFSYTLKDDDIEEVKKACEGYFGGGAWKAKERKAEIIQDVGYEYQDYFYDIKRSYRRFPVLTEIFKDFLKESKIELKGDLYHHSNRENRYNKNLESNWNTGEKWLPIDKKTGEEILPVPFIDSIKNPMFNKSMSILRKLINELIKAGKIDKDTEVVVELARELNDNNRRAAIERYQKLRRDNREKYRLFLTEFKNNEKKDLNVEGSIAVFELWAEQTYKETRDENGRKVSNDSHVEILKEKDAIKRYELWMEQKGQCMYTGKMISISQLFSNEIDIMHTIPRWLLPDNTMANMTVGYARYNRDLQKQKLPKECDNYYDQVDSWGTAIEPRLEIWKQERDKWKSMYEIRKKPKVNEDETKKNDRIQEKHYFKIHLDYWRDKIERFEAEDVKDGWARRQLVDTQMVSTYAREFLKLYFKNVAVQKGVVTADFRKLFGFQEEDKIKSRNRHTHHAIDAAVLTLIPVNSSYRERVLKEYYEALENNDKSAMARLRAMIAPSADFSPQVLIREIEEKTLVVNYEKDKILNQTFKKERKRGKIQYVKDKQGEYVLNKDGNRIIKIAKGDTLRSSLYKDTFLGKIKDVERYPDGKPKRKNGNGDWEYKSGKDEFIYTARKPLGEVVSKVKDIIDPVIRKIVNEQGVNAVDPKGHKIRHVRIRTKSGREVKERINYRSKHDYKNKYYSESDSIPYAILLQKSIDGKVEREMIPIASFEVANAFRKYGKFNFDAYVNEEYSLYKEWDKQLLKVGQKVILLKNDDEFKLRRGGGFQNERLYKITQFANDGKRIMMQHHLESRSMTDVRKEINEFKHKTFLHNEKKYDLESVEIIEDESITDLSIRKKNFEKRKYNFKERLRFIKDDDIRNKIEIELKKYQTEYSSVQMDFVPSYIKMSKNNWNFLCEGRDFEISLLGQIKII